MVQGLEGHLVTPSWRLCEILGGSPRLVHIGLVPGGFICKPLAYLDCTYTDVWKFCFCISLAITYAAVEICIQQEYCWYPYRNHNVSDWIFKSSCLIPARHADGPEFCQEFTCKCLHSSDSVHQHYLGMWGVGSLADLHVILALWLLSDQTRLAQEIRSDQPCTTSLIDLIWFWFRSAQQAWSIRSSLHDILHDKLGRPDQACTTLSDCIRLILVVFINTMIVGYWLISVVRSDHFFL